MEQATSLGFNRTGTQMSPLASGSMQHYADDHSPHAVNAPDGMPDDSAIAEVRGDYVLEAERVGSVPMPGTLTGAFTTAISRLAGKKPEVLIDKLGERLAFERTGVRLYQALIDKVRAAAGIHPLPFGIDDLRHIRDEELAHMHFVAATLETLGADPTAQTPSADIAAVACSGVMQVLTDPRTTVPQCLEALLTAELTDHAGWEILIKLAREAGEDKLLARMQQAHDTEEEHVARVRNWIGTMVLGEAG